MTREQAEQWVRDYLDEADESWDEIAIERMVGAYLAGAAAERERIAAELEAEAAELAREVDSGVVAGRPKAMYQLILCRSALLHDAAAEIRKGE